MAGGGMTRRGAWLGGGAYAAGLAVAPFDRALAADVDADRQGALEGFRWAFPVAAHKAGLTLDPKSPSYEKALLASFDALLSVKPADCSLTAWMWHWCGNGSYSVGSHSMMPTLLMQENVMTLRATPDRPYGRGDLVVHTVQNEAASVQYVRRIIGLPGETVHLADGVPVIDGQPVERTATDKTLSSTDGTPVFPLAQETLPDGRSYFVTRQDPPNADIDTTPPVKVPAGHVFTMGDNRENAVDSRLPIASRMGTGPIAIDAILGRIAIVYLSSDVTRIGLKPV